MHRSHSDWIARSGVHCTGWDRDEHCCRDHQQRGDEITSRYAVQLQLTECLPVDTRPLVARTSWLCEYDIVCGRRGQSVVWCSCGRSAEHLDQRRCLFSSASYASILDWSLATELCWR